MAIITAVRSYSRYQIGVDAYGDGVSAWFCECCEVPQGAEWLNDDSREDFPICEGCGSSCDDTDEFFDELNAWEDEEDDE